MARRGKRKQRAAKRTDSAAAGIPPLRSDGTRDWGRLEARATRQARRNAGRIEAGETFRAQKDSAPEKAPSKSRRGRLS